MNTMKVTYLKLKLKADLKADLALGSTLSAGQIFFFSFCTSKFAFLEPGVSFYINYMAIATHNRRENNQQRQSSSSTISRRLART